MDWSFDLLGPGERVMFPRLSVFAGTFTVEAAEAVCGDDIAAPVDALAALVDCNLVDYVPSVERYRLLETMRLYGEQRLLASGELAALRDAHNKWFVEQVCRVPLDEAFVGCGASTALVADFDNIRAALRWSEESDDWETIGRLVPQLAGCWLRGDPAEGTDWAARALEHLAVGADVRFGCLAAWIVLRLGTPPPLESGARDEYTVAAQQRDRYTELVVEAGRRHDGFAVLMQGWVAPDIHAAGLATGDDSLCTLADRLMRDALERARQPEIGPVWRGFLHMGAGQYALTVGDVARASEEYALALDMLEGTPATGYGDLVAQLALTRHLADARDAMAIAQRAIAASPSEVWVGRRALCTRAGARRSRGTSPPRLRSWSTAGSRSTGAACTRPPSS